MYCCLLLQIYLCYLWLLLCSRDTFEACMKDNVVEVTFSSFSSCEFVCRTINVAVSFFKVPLKANYHPVWPQSSSFPSTVWHCGIEMLFFSMWRQASDAWKPLGKSEGLFIFRRAANTRGCELPLPLCFSNTKGCALDRLLLCLHLCGLERNNGVVLQKTSMSTLPLPALLFKPAVVKSLVSIRDLL